MSGDNCSGCGEHIAFCDCDEKVVRKCSECGIKFDAYAFEHSPLLAELWKDLANKTNQKEGAKDEGCI